ncbi:F0F1 ATP synthase subunit delta [Streptomyces sp. WMMB 322]|uniref:F0F1 ATP synthase subunit delta n=1 Tax=Streptomyces sp. WMMB 322 TaxID=1286821 RepID=UPI0006E1C804|nr:F0F1 ATP synthase subunit delta [Streptomyces sp. WMMB 322]SCK55452.1 F-type H+-transporting ATPase subunit delta [Streptomyces sp. WMMB 322]
MNGASRDAQAAARESLTALTDNTSVDATQLADELAAVTGLLDREVRLRRVLADPSRSGEQKAELVRTVLGDRVGGPTVDLVSGMVRSRWSAPRDLVDATEELADSADLVAAERAGSLEETEDELFRFSRTVASAPDLRAALANPSADPEAKARLVQTLLGGKVRPATERLVTRLVSQPRGRSLEAGIEGLSKLAAERRDRSVAIVTSAVPLSDQQKERLGSVLARLYGRRMHLNLDVDPEVLGGITVRIGDEVINGSIADRLSEAERRMAG